MLNLIFLIGCLLAVPAALGKFLDEVWLLDGQKRRLRERFVEWWILVVDYDRIKFALAWISASKRMVDVFFGQKLFSKKAFFRCTILATGFLIGSLALTGLLDRQILGIMPWVGYHESCKAVSDYADFIAGSGITKGELKRTDVSFSMTNASKSDVSSTAAMFFFRPMPETNEDGEVHGEYYVGFHFYKWNISSSTNHETTAKYWSNAVKAIRNGVAKYDTTKNAAIYSICYYTVIIVANAALFFGSFVLCRIVLSEIYSAGRVVSALSLFISNFVIVLTVSSVSLLVLVVLSIPLFWLFYPFAGMIAKHSLIIFTAIMLGASFSIWSLNCVPLNLMVIIAFLPFLFSVFAALFSVIAMVGRNWIHAFVSSVLLRCAEKSPFLVIGGIFGIIVALITILSKYIQGTIYHL